MQAFPRTLTASEIYLLLCLLEMEKLRFTPDEKFFHSTQRLIDKLKGTP